MIISTMVDVYAVYYPIILSFVWASGAFLSRWKERDKKAIDETKEFFEEKLNNSSLVVIIENSYFENNLKLLENKKVISFFSHHCLTIGYSNIAVPVASFYEKTGTYINCDGIKQKVVSKMNKNEPIKTITTIIEDLKSMIEKGTL